MLDAGGPAAALSDAVAQRALFSLQEAVEVVLQFIEQTCEEVQEEQEAAGAAGEAAAGGTAALVPRALLLAALRALARCGGAACWGIEQVWLKLALTDGMDGLGWMHSGHWLHIHSTLLAQSSQPCSILLHTHTPPLPAPPAPRFSAEVPEAFGGRLRPLLPALLPLRADLGSAAEMEGGSSPAEGASFLLPLLLQVSEPEYGQGGEQQAREHELWLQALGEPAVLRLLARYAQQCAAACAQVSTSAADSAADDALLYACQLLLNVTGCEADPTSVDGSSGAAADRRRQLVAAAEVTALLSGLTQMAAHRGKALAAAHASPDQVVQAARREGWCVCTCTAAQPASLLQVLNAVCAAFLSVLLNCHFDTHLRPQAAGHHCGAGRLAGCAACSRSSNRAATSAGSRLSATADAVAGTAEQPADGQPVRPAAYITARGCGAACPRASCSAAGCWLGG